jgi:cytochrome c-type biogenesis protein CcmH
MIDGLAARLEDNPDDLAGWKMLGRSYMSVRNYAAAADAYDRAVKLESSQSAETLVELGEAILARDNSRIEGQTSALFESALAIEPNNATALFYGGIGAFNRGNKELAADRWEILLGLSPPQEIEQLLRQRIASSGQRRKHPATGRMSSCRPPFQYRLQRLSRCPRRLSSL